MKFLHAAAFAVALTFTSVPVLSAQEPDQDKEKPKQQDEEKKKQPANKEKEKPQPKPDDRANSTQPDKDKPARETERREQPQRQEDRARQDDRSATHEQERNDTKRGGHRIPDERFRASFGTEHHFHVARRDERRFEYGGYAFEYVDAWPADWSDDGDVYVVLVDDDYYLVNVRHPGIRLRLILVD